MTATGAASPVEYTALRPADAAAIAPLVWKFLEHGLEQRVWTVSRLARHLRAASTLACQARCDGERLGFSVLRIEPPCAHLDLLLVLPQWRGRGIARALLDRAATVPGAAEMRVVVRASNERARSFYRARGFREERRIPRHYCAREDAIVLCKSL